MNKVWYVVFAVVAFCMVYMAFNEAHAGRCDGNQGNGQGNYCEPETPPQEPPVAVETDRQYIHRVHTYAHGNSLGIQDLDRRWDMHDDTLASHGAALYAQGRMIGGAYEALGRHESRISSLEQRMDRVNEASAIGLAVAGHQFNTQGGFQTAISASTVSGKQALAIGMGGAINDRLFVNAGIAKSGSTTGGVVSSTIAW